MWWKTGQRALNTYSSQGLNKHHHCIQLNSVLFVQCQITACLIISGHFPGWAQDLTISERGSISFHNDSNNQALRPTVESHSTLPYIYMKERKNSGRWGSCTSRVRENDINAQRERERSAQCIMGVPTAAALAYSSITKGWVRSFSKKV